MALVATTPTGSDTSDPIYLQFNFRGRCHPLDGVAIPHQETSAHSAKALSGNGFPLFS